MMNKITDKDPLITFDSDVYQTLRKLLGVKDFHCVYCGKKISKTNIGGFTKNKKIICRNTSCMIEMINEQNRSKEALI